MYNKYTLQCFKFQRTMTDYDACVKLNTQGYNFVWRPMGRNQSMSNNTKEQVNSNAKIIPTDEAKVSCRTTVYDRLFFLYFKDAEIDSCSWNWFENMAKGSDGVECPNLEELKAHADMMDKGQKITCKRYLKNRDSMIIYIIDFNL